MKTLNAFFFLVVLCLAIEASGQFTNSGNFKISAGGAVSFFGDVNNNGAFLDSGLVVNMAGSTAQSIGGSSIVTFNNLTIINSSVSGITLAQRANVRGNLTFNSGVVTTTATNILQLNNLATSTGASNSSFVSGPVCKTGNQAFVFPVGKNMAYAPVSISAPASATDQFTSEYFNANPDPLYSVNSKDATIDHVSLCEYWMLDRTTGTSNVTVGLSWDTRSCGVTSLTDLRVANWNGTQWKDRGNGGTTGTTGAGTIASSASVTSFGAFTLSSSSAASPLPIELVSFSGVCAEGRVVLEWSTATETNNDFFTVERSLNGLDWTDIDTVSGAGNSTAMINYHFTDTQPNAGTSYYRLNQTDYDGTDTYSAIIDVPGCNESTEDQLSVFPNPSTGAFNFTFSGNMNEVSSIEVYNALGQQVFAGKTDAFISLSNEQAGVYFFHLNLVSKTIVKKIVLLE